MHSEKFDLNSSCMRGVDIPQYRSTSRGLSRFLFYSFGFSIIVGFAQMIGFYIRRSTLFSLISKEAGFSSFCRGFRGIPDSSTFWGFYDICSCVAHPEDSSEVSDRGWTAFSRRGSKSSAVQLSSIPSFSLSLSISFFFSFSLFLPFIKL